jgi:hypothetical protein
MNLSVVMLRKKEFRLGSNKLRPIQKLKSFVFAADFVRKLVVIGYGKPEWNANQLKAVTKGYDVFFSHILKKRHSFHSYVLVAVLGSGKTQVLKMITNALDLEHLASHRGSAFGDNGIQPSQIRFENELALDLMKIDSFTDCGR